MFENLYLDEIRTLIQSFPGTSERISHGAPTFFIGSKLSFVQYHNNHHGDGKLALWCAAAPGMQATLVEAEPELYYVPAYVGYLGWVGLRLDRHARWTDIAATIGDAYLARAPHKYKALIAAAKPAE
ncbi:MmcQ/YjbR family DNA-binding protein [Paenibacillus cymbidii]|uniref:MmcQ/YjbR family DNA-binding protein n=1 Tax=Paenibacillus cymbidii TaxID=1639034 RepID=UPI0010804AF3|nr:MmcQ/YjbR family DNA-binding protein [Paenibacillus cymbidii]